MLVYHVATAVDWQEAVRRGRYATSTRGLSLADVGFIHGAYADQWEGVRRRFFADVTEPLVLLAIDTARLTVPVVDEPDPSGEQFPHLYGELDPAAVVQVLPLGADPRTTPVPPTGGT